MSDDGFDLSGFRKFVTDLKAVPAKARMSAELVIIRGAVNVKKQLRDEMDEHPHFSGKKKVSASITYDLVTTADASEARIGPTKRGAGPLATIAYFGTSRGGGTVPDPYGALLAESDNVTKHMTDLMGEWL